MPNQCNTNPLLTFMEGGDFGRVGLVMEGPILYCGGNNKTLARNICFITTVRRWEQCVAWICQTSLILNRYLRLWKEGILAEFVSYVVRRCQGHSSLDAPSELNPPQRIPSPLFVAPLVPQAEG